MGSHKVEQLNRNQTQVFLKRKKSTTLFERLTFAVLVIFNDFVKAELTVVAQNWVLIEKHSFHIVNQDAFFLHEGQITDHLDIASASRRFNDGVQHADHVKIKNFSKFVLESGHHLQSSNNYRVNSRHVNVNLELC